MQTSLAKPSKDPSKGPAMNCLLPETIKSAMKSMKLTTCRGRNSAFSCAWVLRHMTRKIRAKIKALIGSNDEVFLAAGGEIGIREGVENRTATPERRRDVLDGRVPR
ncbi:hypothetical protein Nepgr_017073 [Nepenthes gracilis]|uniref:Uncharacterized protein n=1 Tax=Nepenthes gracilis TaxID=150966 RepID=A0AAD3SQH5_NEPGR|nr:hypothetical protein Nepgr_017073 [Nepenthes gracilis]